MSRHQAAPITAPNPIRSSGLRVLTRTHARTHTHERRLVRDTAKPASSTHGQTPSELERPRLAGPPAETNPQLNGPLEQKSTAEAPSLPVKHADRASWGPVVVLALARGDPETLVSQIFKMNPPFFSSGKQSKQASKTDQPPSSPTPGLSLSSSVSPR